MASRRCCWRWWLQRRCWRHDGALLASSYLLCRGESLCFSCSFSFFLLLDELLLLVSIERRRNGGAAGLKVVVLPPAPAPGFSFFIFSFFFFSGSPLLLFFHNIVKNFLKGRNYYYLPMRKSSSHSIGSTKVKAILVNIKTDQHSLKYLIE